MDVPRKSAAKKRLIKRIVIGAVILAAIPAITIGLSRLKPAAPTVERSTIWPGTVQRGSMVREVRGLGTLVPEETLLIPATVDGRISRIIIKPGTPVKPSDVILTLESPELQTALLDAEFQVKQAEANLKDLKVQLESKGLDQQTVAAQVQADYHTAKLKADRDLALAKEGLVASVDAQISDVAAKELKTRTELESKRLSIANESVQAQLDAQRVKVEQLREQYKLKLGQVEALKVRSGVSGMLQSLPTPVEQGQKVTVGTPLAKVAQPSKLKAELKIAETQAKDVAFGQPAVVDTRNGLINGRVSRIDPSSINGTVTVDVRLEGELPLGARPDLSVDGTIQLEKLNDVVYVARPVFGQQDSTVSIFKLDPDGKGASKVQVKFGRSSVNTIEVKEGLRVGETVILSDMSAYDAHDRIRLN